MPNDAEPARYVAATIGAVAHADAEVIEAGEFRLHPRRWRHDTFDVHSLGANHKIHFQYVLLDVFWNHVRLEIEPVGATSAEDAKERLSVYRVMLYVNGVAPFIMPFLTTHSVNEIAGLNRRDGSRFDGDFPPELRQGLTSKSARIEAWPHEMSFSHVRSTDGVPITFELARRAQWQAQQWVALERQHPALSAVRHAMEAAPMISHIGSSLLHIWTALESLFPNVHTEVTFRVSLLLAALSAPVHPAAETYEAAKRSYVWRSKAAHGNLKGIGAAEWDDAWTLLRRSMAAVIHRRSLPSESELLSAMLSRGTLPSSPIGSES